MRDRLDHVAEIEMPALLGNAGLKNNLEEEIAQFSLEIPHIPERDGVGDLVGFLDRIRDDGLSNVCAMSQPQPVPGRRKAAMISISRLISRDGCIG